MVKECTVSKKFFSLLSAGLKPTQSVERTKTVQVLDILLFDYLEVCPLCHFCRFFCCIYKLIESQSRNAS
jgi:hypothetical protein